MFSFSVTRPTLLFNLFKHTVSFIKIHIDRINTFFKQVLSLFGKYPVTLVSSGSIIYTKFWSTQYSDLNHYFSFLSSSMEINLLIFNILSQYRFCLDSKSILLETIILSLLTNQLSLNLNGINCQSIQLLFSIITYYS